MILFHLFLGGFSKIPNSKKIVFKMFFRPFYVILDNFRNIKFLLFIWGRTEGGGVSDPRVNFSLIVHINILKKPPQIIAHKSHVKNEFHAILDIFTLKNTDF